MEAGYDYLLLRGRFQRKFAKFTGIFFLVLGGLLLASGGAYYAYTAKARADLAELNVTLPGSLGGAEQLTGLVSASYQEPSSTVSDEAVVMSASQQDDGLPESAGMLKLLPAISPADIRARQLYPGEALSPGYWSNSWAYEPSSYRELLLLQGFTPLQDSDLPPGTVLPNTSRLRVPSIGIDSTVKELAILELGGSRTYETPANTVGHISETANAGEIGSSWFFGHTESPTLREGSVFFNLSKIPDKLRNGEDVFIIADNREQQFLYRVTSSQVVSQEEMRLFDTGEATIHLVSCVPRWVYDHRLIITGELVAHKSNT